MRNINAMSELLADHQYQAFMRTLDAEYAEQCAREAEQERVYAMPLGAALDALFGPGESAERTLIDDAIQYRFDEANTETRERYQEDLAADIAADRECWG